MAYFSAQTAAHCPASSESFLVDGWATIPGLEGRTKAQERAPNFLLLVLTVSLGALIAPLNSTMIAVALPDIRDDFGIGRHEVGWLVSGYLIAMAVAMPIGGRIGDQIGRAKTFRLGLAGFVVFSLAAAVAPSFVLLVLLRIGQALVGAVVIPNGMAMLRSSAKQGRFGEANGIVGSVIGLSAAVGPVLGGVLLEAGSWRWLFLANVPLVAAALLCQVALSYREEASARQPLRADLPGALLLTGLLAGVTFLLSSFDAGSAAALSAALVVSVVCAGLFIRRQRFTTMPIAEWSLFKHRSFTAATGFILLSNLVMYTSLLSIPFFMKEVQGRADSSVGLVLGSMSILMTLLAPVTGRMSDKRGRRLPAVAGGFCMTLATLVLAIGITQDASMGFLGGSLALLGLGIGLGTGPATAAAIESAGLHQTGVASGTVSMMRYIGSIIGAGALGTILGEGAVPGVGVFRGMFIGLVITSALTTLAASQIHRFVAASTAAVNEKNS